MSDGTEREAKFRRASGTAEVILDAVDQELLAELMQNGRLSNKELAGRVGIAPSTCSLRVRRLTALGVIRGFHADVAPEALGRPIQALIAVRVQPGARPHIGDMTAKLAMLPGVTNVYFVAGSMDFLIQVAVESPERLREFVSKHLSASRQYASTETSLVFEHAKGEGLKPPRAR